MGAPIRVVVEGQTDLPVIGALLRWCGWSDPASFDFFVARGKGNIRKAMPGFRQAAQFSTWVIFQDSDGECPLHARQVLASWPNAWEVGSVVAVPQQLLIRIVDTCIESWVLADSQAVADFFHVDGKVIAQTMASKGTTKAALLTILAQSALPDVRERAVRRSYKGNLEFGPAYLAYLEDFAEAKWSPARAVGHNDSLHRAVKRLRELHRSLHTVGEDPATRHPDTAWSTQKPTSTPKPGIAS